MSGNPDDTEGGDGGQPQGGQPPGGQPPQGGQPNGGQPPQGGQPQGQPPQGGQPQGHAPPQTQQTSFVEENQLLVDWTVFTTILFAIAGAALGLFFIIFNGLDQSLVSAGGGGPNLGAAFAAAGSVVLLYIPLSVAILVAPFVGSVLPSRISQPDQEIFKTAFATLAAGTFVVELLGGFMISTTFGSLNLEFGGFLIMTILAALVAGGASAGGAWTMLNQYPE